MTPVPARCAAPRSSALALLIASAAAAQGDAKKVLRYAFPIAETGFDTVQLSDLYSRTVTANIFDGLYDYDHLARPFKIKPNTAVGMPEVSPDFRVWTVRIQPGIYFADDPAFNGKKRELVARGLRLRDEALLRPALEGARLREPQRTEDRRHGALREAALKEKKPFDYDREVEGLRALDRYTIQFRFEEPQPRFLQTIAGGDLYGAVAREVVEAYGDDDDGPSRSAPARSASSSGAATRRSCSSAIRTTASAPTTPSRTRTTPRGRRSPRASRAAGCR